MNNRILSERVLDFKSLLKELPTPLMDTFEGTCKVYDEARNRFANEKDKIKKEYDEMALSDILFSRYLPANSFFVPQIHLSTYRRAAQFAIGDMPILIQGKTGTGKSHMAQFIHLNSFKNGKELVLFNAAYFDSNERLYVELFGSNHEKFSNAKTDQIGLIEKARDSTLFIDEIDKLPINVQGILLHVIETKKYRPLGDENERDATCRFVFATNADLAEMAKDGLFLNDLYWRIQSPVVSLPEFKRWLLPTKVHFFLSLVYSHLTNNIIPAFKSKDLQKYLDTLDEDEKQSKDVKRTAKELLSFIEDGTFLTKEIDRHIVDVSSQTDNMQLWDTYDWPGNQREFLSYINEALATTDWVSYIKIKLQGRHNNSDTLKPSALSDESAFLKIDAPVDKDTLLKLYAEKMLALHDGDKSKAAAAMGINRGTIDSYLNPALKKKPKTKQE
jgi:DNA-binding NtrC family response regulator